MSVILVKDASVLRLLMLLVSLRMASIESVPLVGTPMNPSSDAANAKTIESISSADLIGPTYAALSSIVTNETAQRSDDKHHMDDVSGKSSADALADNTKQPATKLFMKADSRKRKLDRPPSFMIGGRPEPELDGRMPEWKCPNITSSQNLECGCDMPHTLRCSGDIHSLGKIAKALRQSPYDVSLLDCTLKNVTFLSDERIFENISLHGLVISSGEIKRVHRVAFQGLKTPLQALGLPNNALMSVPWNSLTPFGLLERLDLSNNRIKALGATDFVSLPNLTFLELSDNQISSISLRAFSPLKRLTVLKLNGNRMADFSSSLHALGQSINLRELDLKSNGIAGPLTRHTLPPLAALESLNLDRNSFTSIQNGAMQSYPLLVTLSLRHNQIDVLQDHAFSGLGMLQSLDLAYNGIVAVSGASLQHLGRLLVLDLTHNFLRALTADLTSPLPALRELRLDGNDISIVARNALDGTGELHSLSLQDNPLSCDCTLRPFAEWLSVSMIPSQDLLGAICATPPHLEGAPLLQVPLESLSCEPNGGSVGGGSGRMSSAGASMNELDNANVLQQLDAISHRENNWTAAGLAANGDGGASVRDSSDVITLKRLHLSADYGMILTWSVNMRSDEFTCDAVFVYKELLANEILLDNSPIHCESYMMDDENIVSVILRDTSGLIIGDSYRFCLVLLHERNVKRDLVVGCSNQTKLLAIEADDNGDNDATADDARLAMPKLYGSEAEIATDYASPSVAAVRSAASVGGGGQTILVNNHIGGGGVGGVGGADGGHRVEMFGTLNRSFLPGLAMGILITGLVALIWGIIRLKMQPLTCAGSSAAASAGGGSTTCYAASSNLHIPGALDGGGGVGSCSAAGIDGVHVVGIGRVGGGGGENHNRYLKLQATTSL